MNSIFEIFKIGIGPSSSHTVAPMKASKRFRDELLIKNIINDVTDIKITLYGSLAFTGKGHGSDLGIILGLSGITPEEIDNKIKKRIINKVLSKGTINLNKKFSIPFLIDKNIIFDISTQPKTYSNTMTFNAYNKKEMLLSKTYYSIGGGFIKQKNEKKEYKKHNFPYTFNSCTDMLKQCKKNKLKIHELIMTNEQSLMTKKKVEDNIFKFWNVMNNSIENGPLSTISPVNIK